MMQGQLTPSLSKQVRLATESKYIHFNGTTSASDSEDASELPPLDYDHRSGVLSLAKDYFRGSVWHQLSLDASAEQAKV